jgi:hypothetical protein
MSETDKPLDVLLDVQPRRQKNESGALRMSETEKPLDMLPRCQKNESGVSRMIETNKPLDVLPSRQKNESGGLRMSETEKNLNVLPRRQQHESCVLRRGEPELPSVVLLRHRKSESGGLRICETKITAAVLRLRKRAENGMHFVVRNMRRRTLKENRHLFVVSKMIRKRQKIASCGLRRREANMKNASGSLRRGESEILLVVLPRTGKEFGMSVVVRNMRHRTLKEGMNWLVVSSMPWAKATNSKPRRGRIRLLERESTRLLRPIVSRRTSQVSTLLVVRGVPLKQL